MRSILVLAHLLDGNPVLSFGRNIKLLGRFLDSLLLIGSLDSTETLVALADYIDAPTGISLTAAFGAALGTMHRHVSHRFCCNTRLMISDACM